MILFVYCRYEIRWALNRERTRTTWGAGAEVAICGGLVKVAKSRPSKVAAPQKCAVGVCEEGPEAEQMGDEGIGDSRLLELGGELDQFIAAQGKMDGSGVAPTADDATPP